MKIFKMARNEEKQLGRLNRMWLQQLDEEKLNKAPRRPGLGSLHTAAEVKKWLPSIKRDIDFCLKQSQVTCYPERQIEEFSTKIEQLTREYKAYVRKIRELEPGITAVPWTDRAYSRKRKLQDDRKAPETEDSESSTAASDANTDKEKPNFTQISAPIVEADKTDNIQPEFALISAPVLENDDTYTKLYGFEEPADIIYNTDLEKQDLPLEFNIKCSDQCCDKNNLTSEQIHGLLEHSDDEFANKCIKNRSKSKSVIEHEYDNNSCENNRDLIENVLASHKGNTHTVTLNCDRLTSDVTGGSKVIDELKNMKCSCRMTTCDSKILKDDDRHSKMPTHTNCSLTCDSHKGVGNVIQRGREMKESEVSNSKKLLTLNLPYSDSSEEDS